MYPTAKLALIKVPIIRKPVFAASSSRAHLGDDDNDQLASFNQFICQYIKRALNIDKICNL